MSKAARTGKGLKVASANGAPTDIPAASAVAAKLQRSLRVLPPTQQRIFSVPKIFAELREERRMVSAAGLSLHYAHKYAHNDNLFYSALTPKWTSLTVVHKASLLTQDERLCSLT
jgi:hypothetical protein